LSDSILHGRLLIFSLSAVDEKNWGKFYGLSVVVKDCNGTPVLWSVAHSLVILEGVTPVCRVVAQVEKE
jgi:hypothetical protein